MRTHPLRRGTRLTAAGLFLLAMGAFPATASTQRAQLPQGGTVLLGHYRVVAYYGGANGPGLGVLGSKSPTDIAVDIEKRSTQWRRFGRAVQPAMELIATVAQAKPGPDGSYSKPIAIRDVQRYLRVAHRHRMLLILDFQPGRAEFIDQVRKFKTVLADPWVSVALDPEWKMTAHQVPGTVIGHAWAHSINLVRDYLAHLVRANALPDKLLVVHQFTTRMLPNRAKITPTRGVEVAFHADGFGRPSAKTATWQRLALPGRPYGAGFKLFLRQDHPVMTADQVMALRPRPDLITYQ
jgi:hypothetical protein